MGRTCDRERIRRSIAGDSQPAQTQGPDAPDRPRVRERTRTSLDEDSSSETMFELAGLQFAQMLANHGGFGLAKLIAKGLVAK